MTNAFRILEESSFQLSLYPSKLSIYGIYEKLQILLFLFFSSPWHMCIDFREREREKHQLVVYSYYPDLGWNPKPRYVLGIEPITFLYTGWCSNQLSHLAKAILLFMSHHLEESEGCASQKLSNEAKERKAQDPRNEINLEGS